MMFGFSDLPEEVQQQIKKQHDIAEMEMDAAKMALIRLFGEMDVSQLNALRLLIRDVRTDEGTGPFYEGVLATISHTKFGTCLFCMQTHEDGVHGSVSPSRDEPSETEIEETARDISETLFGSAAKRQALLDAIAEGKHGDKMELITPPPPPRESTPHVTYGQMHLPGQMEFDFNEAARIDEEVRFAKVLDRVRTFAFDPRDVSDDELKAISIINGEIKTRPLPQDDLDMAKLYDLDDAWDEDDKDKFLGWICTRCNNIFYQSVQDRMLKPVDECQGCMLKAAHG